MSRTLTPEQLRSFRWFGPPTQKGFSHRSRMKQLGFRNEDFVGKPVIAIINTWSEINPCHAHLRERAEAVKRGVWEAGGFPVEVPAFTITETYMKPSPMLYRNLLAMDTEEALRSLPVDGAILMGGCDKTTPGLIMGAISMNLPAIFLPAGPMLRGNYKGQALGSGTDLWKFWAERCAGTISEGEWNDMEACIARSPGFCMTMGTASTMASLAEALGMTLPNASAIPAPDSNHVRMSMDCGRRIVDMVWDDLKPSDILTPARMPSRTPLPSTWPSAAPPTPSSTWSPSPPAAASPSTSSPPSTTSPPGSLCSPTSAPLAPYLMEDFYYGGGLTALHVRDERPAHLDAITVNGKTIGENLEGAKIINADVIRPRDKALASSGGTASLYGNLAPDGAVIKTAAADAKLMQHTGPAIVFKDYDDMEARMNREDLEVDENSVLVLQNAGPLGGPGMPEWGMLPLPRKVLMKGIRDMVRISDARMSGTSYGTCILHVSPESFIGGPLALVQDGDLIELDVASRKLNMLVSDDELARRRAQWTKPPARYGRGYGALYEERVTQAHRGCDFDFLSDGPATPEPAIH